MSARILVVDDIESNRELLKARLVAEYYDVSLASDGVQALKQVQKNLPDIILLDIMMPNMDGYETCRQLKKNVKTRHIPVIMVTSLNEQKERIKGLEAGADEFLTKPIDPITLMARVKNILRLKMLSDELMIREEKGRAAGLFDLTETNHLNIRGDILIVDDDHKNASDLVKQLQPHNRVEIETDLRAAAHRAQLRFDILIVNLAVETFDAMRLCARLRSDEKTRHIPLLAIVDPKDREKTVKALDIGVNDLINWPADPEELAVRVRTQIKRKRYTEYLRGRLDETLELSMIDPLTKLYNRRYLETRLQNPDLKLYKKKSSVLLCDIDYFKKINDNYGHNAGDEVLKEVALRIKKNIRALDIACRYGGEEFVIFMPNTSIKKAMEVANRLKKSIKEFPIQSKTIDKNIQVTISIGISEGNKTANYHHLISLADKSLYAAKNSGRDCIKTISDSDQNTTESQTLNLAL